MSVKEEIKQAVVEAAKKAGVDLPNIIINANRDIRFGDYSTQAALMSRGEEKAQEKAKKIISHISDSGLIEKAEEKNGFINIFLSEKYLAQSITLIIKEKSDFAVCSMGKGKKAQVEFVSANPTGPLHLGNARGGPLGDVIANLLTKSGYEVVKEFYVNDIGTQTVHFAETLFYWQQKNKGKEVEFPGKGYPGKYMEELAKKIPQSGEITELGRLGIEEMMKEIKETLLGMGINYDDFIFESKILSSGKTKEVIKALKDRGETKKQDGAIWFAGKDQKFLKDRECVLVRSDEAKTPTYFANDIAYHKDKYNRGYDLMIDVWGSNHYGHMPRLKEAISSLGLESERLKIILYQYVRLKHGDKIERMAKREGVYITAKQVLEAVGKDAFRMMMLMNAPNTHVDFDLELAKSRSKNNPVYYLQYAVARISGILRKGRIKIESIDQNIETSYKDKYELSLVKELIKYPDLILETATSLEVHHLPYFGINLAKTFHQFYKNCSVLEAPEEKTKNSRLALVVATLIVLKNLLGLLVIDAPERM